MKILKRKTKNSGFTLVDTIGAALILMIIVLGALQYRYHATLEVRKAEEYLTAVEIAEMFCDGWKGADGSETYNPLAAFGSELDMSISDESQVPEGYITLGNYDIQLENTTIAASLSYKDVDSSLRELNVSVSYTFGNSDGSKVFQMTNYCLK